MPIRWYIDADLKGNGKLLVEVRADVTFPGDPGAAKGSDGHPRPPCSIQQGEKDHEWIPVVARAGWGVITRDRHMRSRPAELKAIVDNGAKVFQLGSREALSRWGQLEVVVSQWRRLEELVDAPGPWLYAVSRTALHKEDLNRFR